MTKWPMPTCVRVALPGDVPIFQPRDPAAARVVAAIDSGDSGGSRLSLLVSNVTVSVNATLRVRGIPPPLSAAGADALRASFAVAAFAATGSPNIHVVELTAEPQSGTLQVILQWELASSFAVAIPPNHTVQGSDLADLDDAKFFTEASANASVEQLRSFASLPDATTEAPRIDCGRSPAYVQASTLCSGWRPSPQLNLTALGGGRRRSESIASASAPSFALVLSESIVQGGGAPLVLSAFNASSLDVTLATVVTSTFTDPIVEPAPQTRDQASLVLLVALGGGGALFAGVLALVLHKRSKRVRVAAAANSDACASGRDDIMSCGGGSDGTWGGGGDAPAGGGGDSDTSLLARCDGACA